ncbi:ciliary BBSome complex subunit 1-domain-containing protein [Pelagophyceae sp. CCMP2097]|nr:ciliary BBSome complex subunit 1-domain-containing protein [Pelagophyceae sp. CCMP2097]
MVGKARPGEGGYVSPWLHAHSDQLASIKTNSAGCELVDLEGNGEHALLVADYGAKLLVFRGTKAAQEHPLLDMPVAVCAFYMDEQRPRIPCVGVASGGNVFIYRNLRPLRKFAAPPVAMDNAELQIWEAVRSGATSPAEARAAVKAAHEEGVRLSARSLALLPMDDAEQLASHVARVAEQPLVHETIITCMTTLAKQDDAPGALSGLVIGTESRLLIFMDPTATTKLCEIELPAVPTLLNASGCFDVDWRITVACRDAHVYTVTMGDQRGTAVIRRPHIELEAQVVAVVRVAKQVHIATADSQLHCYLQKGRKAYSLKMPCAITNLDVLTVRRSSICQVVLCALANGEVRFYREKDLVDVLRINDVVAALCCGSYGREDNTLIVVTRSGALLVKMLPRSADFDKIEASSGGPPPEQDVPLAIPKRSKLYLEQTERERLDCAGIHKRFQYSKLKLKLSAATAYLQLANKGEVADAVTTKGGRAAVALTAQVRGLGPFFHIVVELRAAGDQTLSNVPVVVLHNQSLYRMPRAMATVPLLLPGVAVSVIFELECVDENAGTDPLTILVLGSGADDHSPIAASTLTMPQSELLDE